MADLAFGDGKEDKQTRKRLIQRARQERLNRKTNQRQNKAATTIQRFLRRVIAVKREKKTIRLDWNKEFAKARASPRVTKSALCKLIRELCFFHSSKPELDDFTRLVRLGVLLIVHISKTTPQNVRSSYFSFALPEAEPNEAQAHINQLRKLVTVLLDALLESLDCSTATHVQQVSSRAKQNEALLQCVTVILDHTRWGLHGLTGHKRVGLVFWNLFTQSCVYDNLLDRVCRIMRCAVMHHERLQQDATISGKLLASVCKSHNSLLRAMQDVSVRCLSAPDGDSYFVPALVTHLLTVPLLSCHLRKATMKLLSADSCKAWQVLVGELGRAVKTNELSRILHSAEAGSVRYGAISSAGWLLANVVDITRRLDWLLTAPVSDARLYMDVVSGLMEHCNVDELNPSRTSDVSAFLEESDDEDEERKDVPADKAQQDKDYRLLVERYAHQLAAIVAPRNFSVLLWRTIYAEGLQQWNETLLLPVPTTASSSGPQASNLTDSKEVIVSPATYCFRPAERSDVELALQLRFATFHYANPNYMVAMCAFFYTTLAKMTRQRFTSANLLTFNTPVVSLLWKWLRNNIGGKHWRVWQSTLASRFDIRVVFGVFVACYNQVLFVLEDREFRQSKLPFRDLDEMLNFVHFIKMYVFLRVRDSTLVEDPNLFKSCQALLLELYRRDVRTHYAPNSFWLVSREDDQDWHAEMNGSAVPVMESKSRRRILKIIPFVVPFHQRVHLLRLRIEEERKLDNAFDAPAYELTIRRKHVIEDGFDAVQRLGSRLKGKLKVKFLDEHGQAERGIDLGGPFKEFLETLVKEVFRPEYGLFKATPSGDYYPNPATNLIPDFLSTMEFVGRIVGKAMYEGILVDVPFAAFFLCKVLRQTSFISHLESLDKQLYKNLLFLRDYDGDVADLALNFTVSDDSFGAHTEVPLRANGANVDVTNENRIQYIYLVADYHLNRKILNQSKAFLEGLHKMVNPEWINMFDVNELRLVLSGTPGDIDVADWKKHTNYDRTSPSNKVIKWFWQIVERWSGEERQALLRFATSCSRPPLMGFKYLQPAFSIRLVTANNERTGSIFRRMFGKGSQSKAALPTSSTCFNLLKLPTYDSKAVLAEKLSMAIKANTGFHLT